MKKSSRCPICKLSENLQETIHLQYARLGSVLKTYSWFTMNYPRSTMTTSSFENHLLNHLEKRDVNKLKAKLALKSDKDSDMDVKEPIKIYPLVILENAVIVDPLIHMNSLYLNTIAMAEGLYERYEKNEQVELLLLRYLSEARKQLEKIKEMTSTPRNTAEDFRDMSTIEINPKEEEKLHKKMGKELGI